MITQCGRNSSVIASQSNVLLSSSMMFSISNTKGGGGGVGGGKGGMRSGTGGCSTKTVEKPLRRKWILEKWLIWITLLVASILLDCAYGDVMCYECAWQGSTPLPSTNDGVSDVCRPHNFNVDVVHKIKCANGCSKQALYEFENDPSSPPRGAAGTAGNNTSTNRTRTISLDNMTFYVRGCQKDKKTRDACENKSFNDQVYAEECNCMSDYCNGERSGSPIPSSLFSLFGESALAHNYLPENFRLVNRNLVELSVMTVLLNVGMRNLFSVTMTSSYLT